LYPTEQRRWEEWEVQVRGAPGRPGVRAGGGMASLINLGVLVTYIHTPSSPAVGVRRNVRKRALTDIIAMGWRYERCASAGRSLRAALLRCSCVVASSRTLRGCPLRHSCPPLPSSTHGCNALRTIISTLCRRHDMRYDGWFDMLARNDEPHARDNVWVGKRGSQEL
jgi:hypothetical protein